MSSDDGNICFYVLLGAPPGPDPRRASGEPTGGPRAGPDPCRAPGGPRQGPDPRRASGGPRGGPDLRRAPGGLRGGPRAQGRAQGRAHHGPGPDVRAKRALDSSIYVHTVR